MGMKGISPVIAAVLLIAITVTVGVLVSSWVTQWVTTKTSQTSSDCVTHTNYKIDSASFSTTTNNMTIIVTNTGLVELYGFEIQLQNVTDINFYNSSNPRLKISPNITETNPLREQRSAIIILSMEDAYHSNLGNTADRLKVLNKACPSFPAETTTITKE
ncbi:MAG: hypothetical protein KAS04_05955 [Candidatus Aenigmarchaeota archaeon]|nr:hypothetical protein [Candidatus Aenigmarchaeota archaeon]